VSAAQGELEGGGGTSGFNVVAGLCSTARSPYSEGKRPQPVMPDPCGVCSKCRKGRPNGCSASFAHRQDGATGTPRVRHKHAHACRTSCFTCASHLYRRTTRMKQEAAASLQCYHLSCRLTGHSEVWSKSCRTLRLSADLFPLTNVATLMLSPRSTRTYPPRLQSTRVPVVTLTQYVPDELRQRRQPPPSHLAREERRTQSYFIDAQAAAQRSPPTKGQQRQQLLDYQSRVCHRYHRLSNAVGAGVSPALRPLRLLKASVPRREADQITKSR